MGLYSWFKATIQHRLPSESKVRAWLLILLIIVVCLGLLIIALHRYSHTFWQDKPVAFTTLLPTPTGIIKHSALPSYTSNVPPISENMSIQIIDGASLSHPTHSKHVSTDHKKNNEIAQEKTVQILEDLWSTNKQTVHEWLNIPDTRIALFYDNQQVVGTLVFYPSLFHTPVEENLSVFVAHHLYVAQTHRKQNIAIHLMEKVLDRIRKEKKYEPVVLFQVPYRTDLYSKNRLPFAEVARVMRVKCTLQPLTLPDPDTTLTHSIVNTFDTLPKKASENSHGHIHTKLTLEPASDNVFRRNYWNYCIQQPNHVILSVGGEDWIHIIHQPKDEAVDEIVLKGFSYSDKDSSIVVSHILHYMKQKVHPEHKTVHLIVSQSLVSTFNTHSNFPKDDTQQQWEYYDGHFLYMYNYKLNPVNVLLPYTMNLSM